MNVDYEAQMRRTWWSAGGVAVALAVLSARLIQLQIIAPPAPSALSGDNPEYKIIRPARRGAILDSHGAPLALSRLVVTVRADPLKIGPFAPEVAEALAPSLGLDENQTLARLLPVAIPRPTNAPSLTDAAERFRRNNGVATNVPIEVWEPLSLRLHTNRFAAETLWLAARTNALRALARARAENPPWHWRARRQAESVAKAALYSVNTNLAAVRRAASECRAAGVFGEVTELRVYPHDSDGAHVIGYTTNGPPAGRNPGALAGAAGIEQRFDGELRGDNGVLEGYRYAGKELAHLRRVDLAPREGLNVVLNLDANIQAVVERALDDAMALLSCKAMSAIIVRPRDGAVLALANRPAFNPNQRPFPSLDGLLNRAISAPAEPGSTFKIVTYSAALDLGVITLETPVDCEGGRWVPPGVGHAVNDDQSHRLSTVPAEEAFASSSNVGAAKIGLAVGPTRLRQYMASFGFLTRTGIECGEQGVVVRPLRDKKGKPVPGSSQRVFFHNESAGGVPSWDIVTASRVPYGYGFFATALQTCMAAAAVANDGIWMPPHLVRRVETADGRLLCAFDPGPGRRIVRSSTARAMVQAMRQVVVAGTGKEAALADYDVCGKTGTSKKVDPATHQYSSALYYSSFVGFLPAEAPEICVMINADEPRATGHQYYGGKACAPVFREIATRVASYLALPPSPRAPAPASALASAPAAAFAASRAAAPAIPVPNAQTP